MAVPRRGEKTFGDNNNGMHLFQQEWHVLMAVNPKNGRDPAFSRGSAGMRNHRADLDTGKRTMFVGIRHPGENGNSHFPDGGDALPRSRVIAIRRKDGGVIG